jgi:hypothetical protein
MQPLQGRLSCAEHFASLADGVCVCVCLSVLRSTHLVRPAVVLARHVVRNHHAQRLPRATKPTSDGSYENNRANTQTNKQTNKPTNEHTNARRISRNGRRAARTSLRRPTTQERTSRSIGTAAFRAKAGSSCLRAGDVGERELGLRRDAVEPRERRPRRRLPCGSHASESPARRFDAPLDYAERRWCH